MANTGIIREASEGKSRPAESAIDVLHTQRPSDEVEEVASDTAAMRRQEMIAVRAYFLAEARAFAGGCELDDWLRAEAEIDACLPRTPGRSAATNQRAKPGREGGR